jgi:hypothetical protein
MAGQGRAPAGERDTPAIANTRTHSPGGADEDKHIENTITYAHPMGQTPGSALPPIANVITKAGPNK